MSSTLTIREQFRRNAVALISLAIAVTSLGYNTWRNEASEHNRNQRVISMIAEGGVPESAERLFNTWEDESGSLGSSDEAKERIENALKALRRDTQDILRNLD